MRASHAVRSVGEVRINIHLLGDDLLHGCVLSSNAIHPNILNLPFFFTFWCRAHQTNQRRDGKNKNYGILIHKFAEQGHTEIAKMTQRLDEHLATIESYKKELGKAKELNDRAEVGSVYKRMGIACENKGEYGKAIEYHCENLKIAEELGDKSGIGKAHESLGIVYNNIGEYQKAIDCSRKVLKIAEESGEIATVGDAHGHMGKAYQRIGKYKKAIENHKKNLDICKLLGDRAGVGKAHGQLGVSYQSIGDYQNAIESHSVDLDIAIHELSDRAGEARANGNKGNTFVSIGEYQKAIECHGRDLAISAEIHDRRGMGRALGNIGEAYNFTGENIKAIECHHKALKIAEEFEDKRDVGKAHGNLGNVYHSIGQYEKAKDYHHKHLEIAVELKDKGGEAEAYGNLGTTCFKIGEGKKAIEYHQNHCRIAEKIGDVRGVAIAQFGLGTCHQIDDSPLACSFFAKSILTFDRIRRLSMSKDELNACVSNTFVLAYELLLKSLLNLKQVKAVEALFDAALSNVIHSMQDGSIISYTFDDLGILHAWVISKVGVFHEHWKATLSFEGTERDSATLKELYSAYFLPIEKYVVGSKILVVLEGSLFNLPFGALLNRENEHICEKYSLQFTPALHVLNSSLSKPLPELGHALFVGDPTVGTVTFANQLISVPRLPGAKAEAEIGNYYFCSEPLLNSEATKENVLKNMKDASVIHIAAISTEQGGILLAPNEGTPNQSEEDYLLTAEDVLECTLSALLVVLSCCHSSSGKISPEGVVGIARSFLGAGARSVMATIWSIPDVEMMEFMELFYAKVFEGLSICTALQKSTVEFNQNSTNLEWNTFQVVGEDITLHEYQIEEICHHSSLLR